jgi:hypothetical protein
MARVRKKKHVGGSWIETVRSFFGLGKRPGSVKGYARKDGTKVKPHERKPKPKEAKAPKASPAAAKVDAVLAKKITSVNADVPIDPSQTLVNTRND